jgi:hypothetical protein
LVLSFFIHLVALKRGKNKEKPNPERKKKMAGGKNVKTPPDQPLTSSPPGSFIFPTALQGEEDSRQLKRFGLESSLER